MSAGHTEGRVEVQHIAAGYYDLVADLRTVASYAQHDNARRLAACWNACQGIDTEKLEKLPASFGELLSAEFQVAIKDRGALELRISNQRTEINQLLLKVAQQTLEHTETVKSHNEFLEKHVNPALSKRRDELRDLAAARALLADVLGTSTRMSTPQPTLDRIRTFLAGEGK